MKLKTAWYEANKGQAHERVSAIVSELRAKSRPWRDSALFLMQLRAGSQDITGEGLYLGSDKRMRYNLCSSTVDTAASIVASTRPVPQIVTKAGDWSLQRKAKLRTRCLQTQAMELGLYAEAARAFDDACTVGLGAVHFLPDTDTGLTSCERVHPLELVWDWNEARSGKLRSLYRVRLVSREVLSGLYPTKSDKIDASAGPAYRDYADFQLQRDPSVDQVAVFEAWHLPSSSKSDNGRHVICTNLVTLSDEPWTRPRLPFGFFRWGPRQLGFLGRSLVEEVRPAQSRIHAIIEFVETCQVLGSKPQVWLPRGANVEPSDVDNMPMSVNEYDGLTPPVFQTFNATPQDLEQQIDRIREQTWSMLGLNQQQISGERPAGVSSAVGMKTLEDTGSRRHAQNLKHFEASMLECFQALADCNDAVAERLPSFEVRADARGKFLETSKWRSLRISEGECRVSVFPVSSLPTSPTGRYDRVQELVQAGWITPAMAAQLLGLPDIEAYEDLETADLRYAQRQISRILDGEQGVLPEPFQSPELAADLGRKAYLSAREEGAPEELCAALREYVLEARAKMQEAQPQPAAPPQAQPVASPAMAQQLPQPAVA